MSFQNYDRALKFIDAILKVEPQNHQAEQLKEYTKQKMKKGFPTFPIPHLPSVLPSFHSVTF